MVINVIRSFVATWVQKFRLKMYRMRGYHIGDDSIIEKVVLDKVNPGGGIYW